MPRRVNGTGTTIAPIPAKGEYSFAMYWFTFLFIPLIPLGWRLIKGAGGDSYYVIKTLTYGEVKKALGIKGMLLTIGWGYFINIAMLIIFFSAYGLMHWLFYG